MDNLTVREIIEQVSAGQIRIPAFQRGFVWEPDRVAHLMDSIYKMYPFGALLFWRTNEQLDVERELGPFILPEPKEDYPIDYVLDGQQRITSVYATFQTDTQVTQDENWKDIYYDHTVADDAQEPKFFALLPEEVDENRHFPLRTLFDTTAYRRATRDLSDELAEKIDAMQSRFKEANLPVQLFRTDQKATVATIFERINRQGVPLDTLQLLEAWTWSEDFQLHNQFEDLVEELESKGFKTESFDENLLLRCASSILVGDPRPEAIVEIRGEQIRDRFDEVLNGVLGALDFLQMNLNVRRIENLPFQTLLVPLSVFFAVSGGKQIVVSQEQRDRILRWFWKACFVKRYSSGVLRNLEEDMKQMLQLKGGQQSSLGNFSINLSEDYFTSNNFGIRNVNSKTFVLLLSQNSPRSFISGSPVDLNTKLKDYNKSEFHHMMPRAFLKEESDLLYNPNCLANFCFLSRSENKKLGGVRPSMYRENMASNLEEILESAYCPENLFDDDFNKFVEARVALLIKEARALCE
ncbi:MAG: DUF262 domain-containing protein [Gammaproteobacteria bacterium]|nr:DUF262 domain-containing protein [Gammaproteobacteria bacterium]